MYDNVLKVFVSIVTARRLLLLENVASFLQKKDRVCYIVLYQQIESRRNLCLQDNMRNIMKYILQDSVFAPFFSKTCKSFPSSDSLGLHVQECEARGSCCIGPQSICERLASPSRPCVFLGTPKNSNLRFEGHCFLLVNVFFRFDSKN